MDKNITKIRKAYTGINESSDTVVELRNKIAAIMKSKGFDVKVFTDEVQATLTYSNGDIEIYYNFYISYPELEYFVQIQYHGEEISEPSNSMSNGTISAVNLTTPEAIVQRALSAGNATIKHTKSMFENIFNNMAKDAK